MAEVRIGSEDRRLIEDRLAHRGPHGLARLVITELEVLADLRVLDPLQAGAAEAGMGEKERELNERETVRRNHVERIPQEFIRPCPEGIEVPAVLEDLREFSNADEVRALAFEGVQSDRDDWVRGFDEDRLAT